MNSIEEEHKGQVIEMKKMNLVNRLYSNVKEDTAPPRKVQV